MEKSSRPLMGWFCSYTPLELIHAAGFTPYRIIGHANPIEEADAHMHPNLCQYIRACLDVALEGGYDHLDGFVFVNSCDAMRRLHDVWKTKMPSKFIYIMDLPTSPSEPDEEYFKQELESLKTALGNHAGKEVSDSSVEKSVDTFMASRKLFQEVNDLRTEKPGTVKGSEIMTLIHTYFFMNIEEWNAEARALLQRSNATPQAENPRILLSGSPIHSPEIISFIEECGLNVVYEDICTGSRFFDIDVKKSGDILLDLSKAYLSKPPCSRMMELDKRVQGIKDMVKKFKVDGVLYYSLKFCDVTLYDIPQVKKMLTESDIKVLFLEGDGTLGSFGQLKTRIEAFTELLSN